MNLRNLLLFGAVLLTSEYIVWSMVGSMNGGHVDTSDITVEESGGTESIATEMNVSGEYSGITAAPGNQQAESQSAGLELGRWIDTHNPFESRAGMERVTLIMDAEAATISLSLDDQRTLKDVVMSMESSLSETDAQVRCVPSACEVVFEPRTPYEQFEIPNALMAGIARSDFSYVSAVSWNLPGVKDLYVLYLIREPMMSHLNPYGTETQTDQGPYTFLFFPSPDPPDVVC